MIEVWVALMETTHTHHLLLTRYDQYFGLVLSITFLNLPPLYPAPLHMHPTRDRVLNYLFGSSPGTIASLP